MYDNVLSHEVCSEKGAHGRERHPEPSVSGALGAHYVQPRCVEARLLISFILIRCWIARIILGCEEQIPSESLQNTLLQHRHNGGL